MNLEKCFRRLNHKRTTPSTQRFLFDFFVSVIFSHLELKTKFDSVAQLTKMTLGQNLLKIIKLIFVKNRQYRANYRSTDIEVSVDRYTKTGFCNFQVKYRSTDSCKTVDR